MEDLKDETGLVCCICREGYRYQPVKVGNAKLKNEIILCIAFSSLVIIHWHVLILDTCKGESRKSEELLQFGILVKLMLQFCYDANVLNHYHHPIVRKKFEEGSIKLDLLDVRVSVDKFSENSCQTSVSKLTRGVYCILLLHTVGALKSTRSTLELYSVQFGIIIICCLWQASSSLLNFG